MLLLNAFFSEIVASYNLNYYHVVIKAIKDSQKDHLEAKDIGGLGDL